MAARSKALVCGRSLAGTVGSKHAGGNRFVSYECCVLSYFINVQNILHYKIINAFSSKNGFILFDT